MNQDKFQQVLLFILRRAGKPLHMAIIARIIADTKGCAVSFVQPFLMSDGKRAVYIRLIKGFDPLDEFHQRYPLFYVPFQFSDFFVSSSRTPNTALFTASELSCLIQSIDEHKDRVFDPNTGGCDCLVIIAKIFK